MNFVELQCFSTHSNFDKNYTLKFQLNYGATVNNFVKFNVNSNIHRVTHRLFIFDVLGSK